MGSLLVVSWMAVKSSHTAVEDDPAVTSPSTVLVALTLTSGTSSTRFWLK